MERFSVTPEAKFKTPNEEVAFLRERLTALEGRLTPQEAGEAHHAAEKLAHAYTKNNPEHVLHKGHAMLQPEIDAVVLDLRPEEHDEQISELLSLMRERGVRNALSVLAGLNNPHLSDDFHRFLSEYLKEGYTADGVGEKSEMWKALHMTLFEVSLPVGSRDKDDRRPLKELLSSMEQLYAGLSSVAATASKSAYFTLELAVEAHHEHATLFCSVPVEKRDLFEKQLLSIFPQARLVETKNDYNIFVPGGAVVASAATLLRSPALPLKTFDSLDYDPLNITLSAFAKLARIGEGAALQIVVKPAGDVYTEKYKRVITKLQKGEKLKKALTDESVTKDFAKGIKDFFGAGKKKDEKEKEQKIVDDVALEGIMQKIAQPILETNIRLLASTSSSARSEAILSDLEATFNQFEEGKGNKFEFKRVSPRYIKDFIRDFTYRYFKAEHALPLNIRELTTIFHFPATGVESSRELKRSKAGSAPAPVDLPHEGVLLGINRYRNAETKVFFAPEDRMRHLYVIGQTGTGKTTLLKNMIIQDIENGDGVCMIDPHGNDVMDILAAVPENRRKDVMYFDPSNVERPMGLNMLEYDTRYPEQKTFVVNELFSIFQKLYGKVPESMGPMFEQYFRNATMLVIEDPETGNTLFDVSRVMSDKSYRDLKLSHCKNPIVVQFWRDVAEKAGGEASLANIVPYITSKFDVFLANDIMRPIVVQKTSAFDFRKIMDERKILLVNLSKGRLGDINANLLGLIIVGKILMASLSRVNVGTAERPDFFLYIDEFQNVTTDSIATILSEARKYRLSLTVAHQFIKQLDEKIRDAVFGNVGSLAAFRVGSDDAEYLGKQFAPVFTENDLMNVDNRHAFLRLLSNGRPERPFNIETVSPPQFDRARADALAHESFARSGRSREEVEAEIRGKYRV